MTSVLWLSNVSLNWNGRPHWQTSLSELKVLDVQSSSFIRHVEAQSILDEELVEEEFASLLKKLPGSDLCLNVPCLIEKDKAILIKKVSEAKEVDEVMMTLCSELF